MMKRYWIGLYGLIFVEIDVDCYFFVSVLLDDVMCCFVDCLVFYVFGCMFIYVDVECLLIVLVVYL